jgi:hypothetical protein
MGCEIDWFIKFQLDILRNYIDMMPKTYRKRNRNSVVVRDILMYRKNTAGQTSCIKKCIELGIDPDGYDFKRRGRGKKNDQVNLSGV